MTGLTLLTGRWRDAYDAAKVGPLSFLPVRISVGLPRFWPEARRFPYVAELAPIRLRHLSGGEFEAAYLARLDGIGAEQVRARLEGVGTTAGLPLVLMCFEDVRAGERCHRTVAGRWLEAHLGVAVAEAEPEPPASEPDGAEQLSLDTLRPAE